MALAYVRMAGEINRMTDLAFFARYGEASRIVSYFPEAADGAAGRLFDLHQRHAAAVCQVFDAAIRSHTSDLREQTLPATCLLRLKIGHGGSVVPASKPRGGRQSIGAG